MELNEMKVGDLLEITKMLNGNNSCGETLTKVGDKVFIRTLTYHYTGEVVKDNGTFIELKDSAWIADSGRFSTAISTGELNEVEPIGRCKVLYSNMIDCIEWKHNLPTEIK